MVKNIKAEYRFGCYRLLSLKMCFLFVQKQEVVIEGYRRNKSVKTTAIRRTAVGETGVSRHNGGPNKSPH